MNRFDPADSPTVWARAGERLLVPISPNPAQLRAGLVDVRLDRGDAQQAPIYELYVEHAEPGETRGGQLQPGSQIGGARRREFAVSTAFWLRHLPEGATSDSAASEERWRTRPAGAEVAPDSRGYFALVQMPRDAAGQGLWLGARRAPVGWLLDLPFEPPSSVPSDAARAFEGLHEELLLQLRAPLASPMERWRARLTLQRAGFPGAASLAPFDDPLVEALADQIEQEWTIAIRYLAATDAVLAQRVTERLAGIVVVAPARQGEADRVAVVWGSKTEDLEQLKRLLLGSGRPARRASAPEPDLQTAGARGMSNGGKGGTGGGAEAGERSERAREWLASQAAVGAWIVDDAGLSGDGTDRLMATAGFVHLAGTGNPLAVVGASDAAEIPPSVATLSPGSLLTMGVGWRDRGAAEALGRIRPSLPDKAVPNPVLRLGLGEWRTERELIPDRVGVRPPGLLVGPLFFDWRMDEWWRHVSGATSAGRRASVVNADLDRDTAGLLMFEQSPGVDGGVSRGDWVLYLECWDRSGVMSDNPQDRVTVSFGPFNSPLGIVSVWRSGEVEARGPGIGRGGRAVASVKLWQGVEGVEGGAPDVGRTRRGQEPLPSTATRGDDTEPSGAPHVAARSTSASGWSVWIRVPQGCIETAPGRPQGEGVLRLGVERIGADGSRSAWPRALTFWQSQPGRVRVDLDQWEGR